MKLIVVGMAPGNVEERTNLNFVGPSGKLFDRALEERGGRRVRDDAFVMNAAQCNDHGDDRVHQAAAACCAPRLYREIEAVTAEHGPVPIWALGRSAAKSLLNVRSIILARGFVWTAKEIDAAVIAAAKKKASKSQDAVDALKAESLELRAGLAGRVVLPMLHPAFILRSDTWAPLFGIDIARGLAHLRGDFAASDLKLVGDYVVATTAKEADRALGKFGPVVGMDIETDGVNPRKASIRCVGVSDAKGRLVVLAKDKPGPAPASPWPNELFAPILTKYIRRWKEVVFHNGLNFDLIALERDGVVFRPTVDVVKDYLTKHGGL